MNDSALLDEAFGQLDDDDRTRLELAASSDPVLSDRRNRLHRAIELLLDDDDPEPPLGLVDRTLSRIAEYSEEPRVLELAPSRPRFRWADVGVAAAVMLVGLMALVPAVRDQRQRVDHLTCVDNLRQVGLALNQYASTHQTYPYVDPSCPAAYVGAAFVQLSDCGLLSDPTVLNCPCDGCEKAAKALPRFVELLGREKQGPGTCREEIRVDYAYHQGVRHPDGRLAPIPLGIGDRVPMVADQPPFRLDEPRPGHPGGEILSGNSPNHRGAGQNVLFTDGRVEWRRSRWISPRDTDLYLNQHDQVGPGVHLGDAVVTPCVMRFRD